MIVYMVKYSMLERKGDRIEGFTFDLLVCYLLIAVSVKIPESQKCDISNPSYAQHIK